MGCIGLCYAEPLIDIKKQGQSRLFFNNVSVNNIEQIVEEYLVNNEIKNDYLLKSGDKIQIGKYLLLFTEVTK